VPYYAPLEMILIFSGSPEYSLHIRYLQHLAKPNSSKDIFSKKGVFRFFTFGTPTPEKLFSGAKNSVDAEYAIKPRG
jgi:hypothetical protein